MRVHVEVIYTGLRQTPEMIVNTALQEDVQVIGLSILSGAHNAIVPRVMELLKEQKMTDVLVIVGGIVPDEDAAQLKRLGVATQGFSTRSLPPGRLWISSVVQLNRQFDQSAA